MKKTQVRNLVARYPFNAGLFYWIKIILDNVKHFVYICIDSLIKTFSHELPQDLRQLVS